MRRSVGFGAVIVASGCSLFGGLDEFASEDPPAEAGAPDAPPNVDRDGATMSDAGSGADVALDAGDDAGALPNLHPYPSFESGCGGWGSYKATLEASALAHTGNGSCRVCTDGTDPVFSADDNGVIPSPPIGATYVAEAWVRTDPSKPGPASMTFSVRTRNDDPFEEVESTYEDFPAPTAAWSKLTVTRVVTKPAESLNVVVFGESAGGACYLLDDVAVYRTK